MEIQDFAINQAIPCEEEIYYKIWFEMKKV